MGKVWTVSVIIGSGASLLKYLVMKNLNIVKWSGLYGDQNCIYLPDHTSFNWKSEEGIVRVNCNEEAKDVIESTIGLAMGPNGKGDPTRPFSLLLDNQKDLDAVIEALETIDGNKAPGYPSRADLVMARR
jgi:hypothetical protein